MNLALNQKLKGLRAVTMVEVVISLAISVGVTCAIIAGYINATKDVEWSSYSMAATSLALQRAEQVRAAYWNSDPGGMDQAVSTNFPTTNEILDVPISGTNIVYGTLITTISNVSTVPPLRSIQVDCIWTFRPRNRDYTNTILTYRRPNN